MPAGNRQDNASVTATVQKRDGTWLKLGIFEDRKGGNSDSGSVTYNKGAMGPRLAMGGREEPAPVTITRLFDDEVAAYEGEVRQRVGRAVMKITEQALDDEGQAVGPAVTWTGKLKNYHLLDYNAEGTAAKQVELELVVESVVVA